MAWISVHQQIRDHRKTRELYRMLKISRAEAIGTLVLIWTWAIDNCSQDGKLICCTIEDICDAAYWRKKPKILYDALIKTKWLDELNGGIYIHDWSDFNKPFYDYISRKEKDKLRKRESNSNGNSEENPQENLKKATGKDKESCIEFCDSPSPSPKKEPLSLRNKFSDEGIEIKLATELYVDMKENNPSCKKPNIQNWASNIDMMLRVDKRNVEDIRKIIDFSQHDSFWKSNILSTTKLREKFDQLILKADSAVPVHEEHKSEKEIWT